MDEKVSLHPRRLRGGYQYPILAGASLGARSLARSNSESQTQQPAAENRSARQLVGTIKATSGNTITLKPDTGPDVNVQVQDSTRIVRLAPGQTDLRNAAPLQLPDLQVGDRILVHGRLSGDANSVVASSVITMKRSDIEAKRTQEREDWQRRGIGGLVSAGDNGAGTITISAGAPGGNRTMAIHTTKGTIIRRYAPDSVQFDDARPSSLDQIKPGDQLRARGARSVDGSEFAAEEIVFGSFRNIAGTIDAVDTAANTITVMDLATKEPVLVKVTSLSQIVKLPPQMAQGIALRQRGAAPQGAAGGPPGASRTRETGPPPKTRGSGETRGLGGGDRRPGGRGGNPQPGGAQAGLQQMLRRMPPATLADFETGDAVMIVSTEGTDSGGVTAITLLGGVEPILSASSNDSQEITLSPWNLGGAGGDGAEGGP